MNIRQYLPAAVFLGALVAVQLVISLTGAAFYFTQITMSFYYTIVVIGLCLLMGYAGQISLGHAGFFSIGAYMQAMLTTHDFSSIIHSSWDEVFKNVSQIFGTVEWYELIPEKIGAILGIPVKLFVGLGDIFGMFVPGTDGFGNGILSYAPSAALFISLLTAIGIACLIGLPVLRLKGHYLAMATLGFGIIISTIVFGTKLFGEADGISRVPAFHLVGPLSINGGMADRTVNYYIAGIILFIVLIVSMHIVASRVGRALRAIHGNEQAAGSLGINAMRYKLGVFVLSALFAAIAGVFLVHYNGSIGTSETSVLKSVRYVSIVAAGGMDSIWGVVAMSMGLNFVSLRGYFGSFDEIFFALILVVTMLFLPRGLFRKEYLEVVIKKTRRLTRRMVLKRKLEKKGIVFANKKKDDEK
ncbi:MAG: branched-chain amino acid ABC transporter permease [Spirochaetales bacterium]|nr:branched-chain amino acid ABC transporter permease [Spirochaetales bacterium]